MKRASTFISAFAIREFVPALGMTTVATSLRQELSALPDVSRTWFEYAFEDGRWTKILVVEVACDTDPSSPGFKRSALCDIEALAANVLAHRTTMGIGHL